MFNDQDILRYSNHLLLNKIGLQGQKKLKKTTIIIIGLGGLGCSASIYLSGAGIGKLILVDYDIVDISNIHRQILYNNNSIGKLKTESAKKQLLLLNPNVKYVFINKKLFKSNLNKYISKSNLVIDCTDNILSKHNINQTCIFYKKPLITASAINFHGQIIVITPPFKYGCYSCLFPHKKEIERSCNNIGVIGPVVGIMGTIQALEAIKLICNIYVNKNYIILFNGINLTFKKIKLTKNKNCNICCYK